MTGEIDVYRSAKLLIDQHGEGDPDFALSSTPPKFAPPACHRQRKSPPRIRGGESCNRMVRRAVLRRRRSRIRCRQRTITSRA